MVREEQGRHLRTTKHQRDNWIASFTEDAWTSYGQTAYKDSQDVTRVEQVCSSSVDSDHIIRCHSCCGRCQSMLTRLSALPVVLHKRCCRVSLCLAALEHIHTEQWHWRAGSQRDIGGVLHLLEHELNLNLYSKLDGHHQVPSTHYNTFKCMACRKQALIAYQMWVSTKSSHYW